MPEPASVKPAGAGKPGLTAWTAAARLITRWLERRERVDELFESLPPGFTGAERARCQHLVFGVVRHFGRIEGALGRLMAHPPRFATRAVLFIAGTWRGATDGRTREIRCPADGSFVTGLRRRPRPRF